MAKGYWIAHVDVGNAEEYQKYVEANAAAFRKYKAVCLARGGKSEALEGSGRARNVIWEFPSYEAALECYRSRIREWAKPPSSAWRTLPGSTPAFDASSSASPTASIVRATMIWLATLATCPAPFPPTSVTIAPG